MATVVAMTTGNGQARLSVREHMLLEHFASRPPIDWYRREGMLRHLFGLPPTQVHAEFLALVDRPDAEAAYPVEVHRLRRLMAARRSARSSRRAS